MSSTNPAAAATRRVGRAKATIVALCLGGSLALTGTIAAQAAGSDDSLVNGTATTNTGSTTTTDDTSSSDNSTSDNSSGVSSSSGSSNDATTQGS